MADNFLYVPFICPVKFYDPDRANLPAFFTKHFDDFLFSERLYAWQEPADYCQPWQTTDIIKLQFTSSFDPIIVELVDENDVALITLPALVGIANIYRPGTYSFEVSMSLADLDTGCYRLRITAGSGESQKIYYSGCQFISSTPFEEPTLLLEYWNTRYREDVLFETGIKFQYRLFGHWGLLKPGRAVEGYKDQKQNPSVLSARSFRGFPVIFGDEFGIPDDVIDLLNRIWGCNNVNIDNKSFAAVGNEFEFVEVDDGHYPKRGVKLQVEEGLNRNSKIFAQDVDTSKKMQYGIVVEAKVFGDTSNQGSSNTVPIITVE